MENVHEYCKKRKRNTRQAQACGDKLQLSSAPVHNRRRTVKPLVCTDQVQGVIPQSHPPTLFPGFPPTLPRLEPSSAKLSPDVQEDPVLLSDAPLEIHGYSVEEYQRIYHSVVDDMIKCKSGKSHQYNLRLGRKIKQRLWETLGRPKVTMVEKSEGIMQVKESMGTEVSPPLIDVDISREPHPWKCIRKKAKHKK